MDKCLVCHINNDDYDTAIYIYTNDLSKCVVLHILCDTCRRIINTLKQLTLFFPKNDD